MGTNGVPALGGKSLSEVGKSLLGMQTSYRDAVTCYNAAIQQDDFRTAFQATQIMLAQVVAMERIVPSHKVADFLTDVSHCFAQVGEIALDKEDLEFAGKSFLEAFELDSNHESFYDSLIGLCNVLMQEDTPAQIRDKITKSMTEYFQTSQFPPLAQNAVLHMCANLQSQNAEGFFAAAMLFDGAVSGMTWNGPVLAPYKHKNAAICTCFFMMGGMLADHGDRKMLAAECYLKIMEADLRDEAYTTSLAELLGLELGTDLPELTELIGRRFKNYFEKAQFQIKGTEELSWMCNLYYLASDFFRVLPRKAVELGLHGFLNSTREDRKDHMASMLLGGAMTVEKETGEKWSRARLKPVALHLVKCAKAGDEYLERRIINVIESLACFDFWAEYEAMYPVVVKAAMEEPALLALYDFEQKVAKGTRAIREGRKEEGIELLKSVLFDPHFEPMARGDYGSEKIAAEAKRLKVSGQLEYYRAISVPLDMIDIDDSTPTAKILAQLPSEQPIVAEMLKTSCRQMLSAMITVIDSLTAEASRPSLYMKQRQPFGSQEIIFELFYIRKQRAEASVAFTFQCDVMDQSKDRTVLVNIPMEGRQFGLPRFPGPIEMATNFLLLQALVIFVRTAELPAFTVEELAPFLARVLDAIRASEERAQAEEAARLERTKGELEAMLARRGELDELEQRLATGLADAQRQEAERIQVNQKAAEEKRQADRRRELAQPYLDRRKEREGRDARRRQATKERRFAHRDQKRREKRDDLSRKKQQEWEETTGEQLRRVGALQDAMERWMIASIDAQGIRAERENRERRAAVENSIVPLLRLLQAAEARLFESGEAIIDLFDLGVNLTVKTFLAKPDIKERLPLQYTLGENEFLHGTITSMRISELKRGDEVTAMVEFQYPNGDKLETIGLEADLISGKIIYPAARAAGFDLTFGLGEYFLLELILRVLANHLENVARSGGRRKKISQSMAQTGKPGCIICTDEEGREFFATTIDSLKEINDRLLWERVEKDGIRQLALFSVEKYGGEKGVYVPLVKLTAVERADQLAKAVASGTIGDYVVAWRVGEVKGSYRRLPVLKAETVKIDGQETLVLKSANRSSRAEMQAKAMLGVKLDFPLKHGVYLITEFSVPEDSEWVKNGGPQSFKLVAPAAPLAVKDGADERDIEALFLEDRLAAHAYDDPQSPYYFLNYVKPEDRERIRPLVQAGLFKQQLVKHAVGYTYAVPPMKPVADLLAQGYVI